MKDLPTPKPGQPIRAQDAQEHLRGTKAALNWSVDGVDLEQHGSGKAAVVRPKESLQLVEITTPWQHVPPGQDTEIQPTAWHWCEARILQRCLGQAIAWAPKQPEDRIRLWAPTAYPGKETADWFADSLRDKLRGRSPDLGHIPPNYSVGDWVWAVYHHTSGLWLLVGGYQQVWPAKVMAWWAAGEQGTVQLQGEDEATSTITVEAQDQHNLISLSPVAIKAGWHAEGKKWLPKDTPVLLHRVHSRFVLLQIGSQDKWEEDFWGVIESYEPIPEYPETWLYKVRIAEAGVTVDARNVAEFAPVRTNDLPRLPIPSETIVRVIRCCVQDINNTDNILVEYRFFATNLRDGHTGDQWVLTRTDSTFEYTALFGRKLSFKKGHLVDISPEYPIGSTGAQGPIEVSGNLVPGEAAGHYFPVPGQWNGMPQWRHAQNPNWWIRWQPAPGAGGGGAGGWIIGHWPPGAQEPDKGWRKHPLPEPGQPSDQDPSGSWPEQEGDVEGTPQSTFQDYIIQDCDQENQLWKLLNSSYIRLQFQETILWKDDNGDYHCGRVADFPADLPLPEFSNWRIYRTFTSCDKCPRQDPVLLLCNENVRVRLQDARRYLWTVGTVVRFGEVAGPRYRCGIVMAEGEPDYTLAKDEWWLEGTFKTCMECVQESWPGAGSSPAEPCYPYCEKLVVSGFGHPADAAGTYTYGGADTAGTCWWYQGPWVIERDPQYGWFIVSINDPRYWWLNKEVNAEPWVGRYYPGPACSGQWEIHRS